MGRKKESLQHVLITRVIPSIRNNKTSSLYKKHIKRFVRWAKENGVRQPEDVTKEVIQKYEQYLENSPREYTPATIHTYIAPICVSAQVPMEEIRKPKRKAGYIIRGRNWDRNGEPIIQNIQGKKQEQDPKYARLLMFQRAVGIRRSELKRLTGADLIQVEESWYIIVRRGKGGKRQEQYILPKDVSVVQQIFQGVEPEQRVFSEEEINNKINLHAFRAQHGRECYEYYAKLIDDKPEEADRLRQSLLERWKHAHERLRKEDSVAWERQHKRFIMDMDDRPYILRGDNAAKAETLGLPLKYSRLALMSVSVLHLSHWRLDVTVTNYLIQ